MSEEIAPTTIDSRGEQDLLEAEAEVEAEEEPTKEANRKTKPSQSMEGVCG